MTHYIIEKREALRTTWSPVGTTKDTTMTVRRLNEGVPYLFRVMAVNEVGPSFPEELERSISAKSPHREFCFYSDKFNHERFNREHFNHEHFNREYLQTVELNISLPGPPSSTDAPEVTSLHKDSLVLTWNPPLNDGGSPITGYHVEQRGLSRHGWIRLTSFPVSGTSFKTNNLIPGESYQFRITAENRIGQGN